MGCLCLALPCPSPRLVPAGGGGGAQTWQTASPHSSANAMRGQNPDEGVGARLQECMAGAQSHCTSPGETGEARPTCLWMEEAGLHTLQRNGPWRRTSSVPSSLPHSGNQGTQQSGLKTFCISIRPGAPWKKHSIGLTEGDRSQPSAMGNRQTRGD